MRVWPFVFWFCSHTCSPLRSSSLAVYDARRVPAYTISHIFASQYWICFLRLLLLLLLLFVTSFKCIAAAEQTHSHGKQFNRYANRTNQTDVRAKDSLARRVCVRAMRWVVRRLILLDSVSCTLDSTVYGRASPQKQQNKFIEEEEVKNKKQKKKQKYKHPKSVHATVVGFLRTSSSGF